MFITKPDKSSPAISNTVGFYLNIYWRLIFLHLRSVTEYRLDFWLGVLGAVLVRGSGLIFIWAIFSRIPELGGWTGWEVGVLYAFVLMAGGLREVFCNGPWLLSSTIHNGNFDRLLVRPLPSSLQSITLSSGFDGVGNFLLGLIVLLVSSHVLTLEWTLARVLWTCMSILCATVIVSCIAFVTNLVSFFQSGDSTQLAFLISNLVELVKFPISLYSTLIQIALSTVLPFAYVSYFPTLVLLGKDVPFVWCAYLSPLVAVIAVFISARIWAKAINRYQGAGH